MKKIILTVVFLICAPINLYSAVLFSDNFDSHDDWSPTQLSTSFGYYNSEVSIPTGYHSYRLQGSIFSGTVGNNTLNIGVANARSGKCLTFWSESGGGLSTWASDGLLGINLGGAYNELYIRFYIKFQSNWIWNNTESPIQKFFRVTHYTTGDPFVFGGSGAHHPVAFMDLAKYNNGGSDITYTPSFRYTNTYYPASATPSHADEKVVYLGTGNYSGSGTDFYDSGMMGDGDWHCWEFYVKINSAEGVADGIMTFWQDGVQIDTINDLAWQDNGGDRNLWNYVFLGGNNWNRYSDYTNNAEQWYAIDDLIISTTYVGVENDTTAPTFTSANITTSGQTSEINWSEAVTDGGVDSGDINLDCSTAGDNVVLTLVDGDGTSKWTLSHSQIYSGDTCTLDIEVAATEIVDSAGTPNSLTGVTDQTISNGSQATLTGTTNKALGGTGGSALGGTGGQFVGSGS